MIHLKNQEEVEKIRRSSLLVSKTLAMLATELKAGVNGASLDRLAETFIRDNGGVPAFKNYRGFPNSLCISKNEAVVHGIPDGIAYKEGDIVSIDCGVVMDGYYGDSAFTFAVGIIDEAVNTLLKTTRESLYMGIEMAVEGKRVGDIGYAVQSHCEPKGYGVVRELVGHGVGKNLHEAPDVPNYGKRGSGPLLKKGMVIAIEPMVNLGKKNVVQLNDGWTIVTKDRKVSAHYEHTVAIGEQSADILTSFEEIDVAVKNNANLVYVK